MLDPLFQAECNNPVTVANLVAENGYKSSAVDAIMRQSRVKLSKTAGISEQGVKPQALIKALSLVEGPSLAGGLAASWKRTFSSGSPL